MDDISAVNIMVFGVITSDANVMPPFIFPQGLWLNTKTHTNCTEREVLPGGWSKALCLVTGFCSMPHNQENPVMAVR